MQLIPRPPFVMFWGDGGGVSETNTPQCGGRLTPSGWTGGRRGPRVKAIGSKTAARQHNPKPTMEKKETP